MQTVLNHSKTAVSHDTGTELLEYLYLDQVHDQ